MLITDQFQSEATSEAVAGRLRRDRNWFAVGAVAMIGIATAVSLPRHVDRYRALRAINTELLELQVEVGKSQRAIGNVEKRITTTQQEIRTLQTSSR